MSVRAFISPMPGSAEEPRLEVLAVTGIEPHALGLAVVVVGDRAAQLRGAARHAGREAVDRRPLAEDRLELGWVHGRDRRARRASRCGASARAVR